MCRDSSDSRASFPSPSPDLTGRSVDVRRDDRGSSLTSNENVSRLLARWRTVLAFIWTAVLIVRLTVPMSPVDRERLVVVNLAIWLVFGLAFFAQLLLASSRSRFLRTHIPDLIAVGLPFVQVVQVARIATFLRPAWLVWIVLVGHRAITEAGELFRRERLWYVLALLGISTFLGAAGVYFFERDIPGTDFATFGDALWWALALGTTVNTSADPVSIEGRAIALALRVIAMGSFGFVTASIASFLVTERTMVESAPDQQLPIDNDSDPPDSRSPMIFFVLLGIVGSLAVVAGAVYALYLVFKNQAQQQRTRR